VPGAASFAADFKSLLDAEAGDLAVILDWQALKASRAVKMMGSDRWSFMGLLRATLRPATDETFV
jgi:hypothetical protein